jgi:hypothetical protein
MEMRLGVRLFVPKPAFELSCFSSHYVNHERSVTVSPLVLCLYPSTDLSDLPLFGQRLNPPQGFKNARVSGTELLFKKQRQQT